MVQDDECCLGFLSSLWWEIFALNGPSRDLVDRSAFISSLFSFNSVIKFIDIVLFLNFSQFLDILSFHSIVLMVNWDNI